MPHGVLGLGWRVMSDRSPCVRCGMILHTGEGRITVSFTVDELIDLAWAEHNSGPVFDTRKMVDRLLCAAELLDADKVKETREWLAQARINSGNAP